MSDHPALATGTWLVTGPPDVRALRDRIAERRPPVRLTVHDPAAGGGTDASEWGGLVRDELAAAHADDGRARVLLARLAEDRSLLIVVTPEPSTPDALMRWLLDPATPAAPPGASPDGAADPTAGDPLTVLRTGTVASGYAATLRTEAGPVCAGLRAAGLSAEAALTAAAAVLLTRCDGSAETALVVTGEQPVAVRLRVSEAGSGSDALRAAVRAVAAGTPVPPQARAALAVASATRPAPERIGAFTTTPVHVPNGAGHHELLVLLDGSHLRLDYDTGLFEEEAVTAFARRLLAVLAGLLDDLPLHAVTGLAEHERAALDAWSRGERLAVEDTCLHTLIERHATRTPDAAAVICGADELTYSQLDVRANRLAALLHLNGIVPGSLVGLMAGRAAESVVAMVAVMKAGAAYVPIEPTHPEERLRHILRASGAVALIAHEPPGFDLPIPLLRPADAARLPSLAPVRVAPEDTAYVIYTSGSTGTPKGIAVQHRAIVASTAARATAGPAPGRDLVLPPLCFDGAAGGMFWALANGGTVVLPTEREAHDPLALRAMLERTAVTHVHAVPSHYRILLQIADAPVLDRLAMVAVGGEPLTEDVVAEHLRLCPGAPLFNDYGPTECAVWATTHRCGPAEASGAAIPIGRPVPNYRAHVLDGGLRPVPPGVPGEIFLGGPGVALGYHGLPALTAERFLPDPFDPGRRLYRTGDRGLWSPSGRLLLLGRVDHQVKVRGYRIELGEVESAVLRHPAVAECAVRLHGEGAGERLVAFVALRPGAPGPGVSGSGVSGSGISGSGLRRTLAETLPAQMRPDHVVVLPALPRTPGGKVDSQALRGMADSGTRN
ncbi:amino acid adenylation domain-containing protein [Kitasatospora xanthocidica]|uniref:amino acid adenylation domain-containing protein n=1 Tax=Kitasatospora xanthocidica TaxID=83382 RepID=UPI0036EF2343